MYRSSSGIVWSGFNQKALKWVQPSTKARLANINEKGNASVENLLALIDSVWIWLLIQTGIVWKCVFLN